MKKSIEIALRIIGVIVVSFNLFFWIAVGTRYVSYSEEPLMFIEVAKESVIDVLWIFASLLFLLFSLIGIVWLISPSSDSDTMATQEDCQIQNKNL